MKPQKICLGVDIQGHMPKVAHMSFFLILEASHWPVSQYSHSDSLHVSPFSPMFFHYKTINL